MAEIDEILKKVARARPHSIDNNLSPSKGKTMTLFTDSFTKNTRLPPLIIKV